MKILTYCTGWMNHTLFISDHTMADAAYAAIKAGMDSYDRFANDKGKTISVETGGGCSVTLRLETLVSLVIDDCAQTEKECIERAVFDAGVRAKIAARLAPAT